MRSLTLQTFRAGGILKIEFEKLSEPLRLFEFMFFICFTGLITFYDNKGAFIKSLAVSKILKESVFFYFINLLFHR